MPTEVTGRWEDLVDRPEFRGHEVKITIVDQPLAASQRPSRPDGDLTENDGLSKIVLQVSELLREPEFDDRGRLRPPTDVVERALVLLTDAAPLPPAHVSTDADGGLRVNWEKGDNSVRLIVPPPDRGQGYIFHQEVTQYGVDRDLSARTLARWLKLVS
jgi:hypothetical protein